MQRKKKSLDLSPLSYFVDIPQEEAAPQPPDAPYKASEPNGDNVPAVRVKRQPQPPTAARESATHQKEKRPGRPPVEKENRSKIFSICMTPLLHEDLKLLSELHGVSVNSYIVGLLESQVEKNRASVDQIKAIKKKFNKK